MAEYSRIPESSVFAALSERFKRVDGAPLIAVAKETMGYTTGVPMWVLIYGDPPSEDL